VFRTILAATDGSEAATQAVETAAEIAASQNARLIVLSVVEPGPVPRAVREKLKESSNQGGAVHPLIANIPSWMDSAIDVVKQSTGEGHALMETVAREAVEQAAARAHARGVAAPETAIEYGDPTETIMEAAEKHDADLIVTGRRGLGGITGLMLGSVSSKVSQLSHRCCLLVGRDSSGPQAGR